MPDAPPTLLCVANYPANTGYAWDFIEGLYAGMARRLAGRGIRTLVAYPAIGQPPRTLADSPAVPIELDAMLRTPASVRATCEVIRREGVAGLYLTDMPARSSAYAAVRDAGVRRVIVHDHSSGERSDPGFARRVVKWALARTPRVVADDIVAVSDFVARRHLHTGMMPRRLVTRVWNGIEIPPPMPEAGRILHEAFGLSPERAVVVCACRAAKEKGVPVLLRAFDQLIAGWPAGAPRPALVYLGDGPQYSEIRRLHDELPSRADIFTPGYRADARVLQAGADVCAMPSIWQDALPLAVSQPMALGRAVVASNVGGIPEMIVDGESGLLVPPSDDTALAAALRRLLQDRDLAARLGAAARDRMSRLFRPEDQLESLTTIALRAFPGR